MAVNESEQLLIQEIQEGIIRAEAGKISGASQCTGLSGVKFASYIARELSRAKSIRRTARLTEKSKRHRATGQENIRTNRSSIRVI